VVLSVASQFGRESTVFREVAVGLSHGGVITVYRRAEQ
jgi:hypothetical protein